MSNLSTLLYVDLETGFVGDADGADFERFTERHYASLSPLPNYPAHTPLSVYPHVIRPVVMAMHNGLPTAEELAYSETVLRDGRTLYFHWPKESVVEVVTRERLQSFRRHRRVVNAFWNLRGLRRGVGVNIADLRLRVRSNLARVTRAIKGSSLTAAPGVAMLTRPATSRQHFDFIEQGPDGFRVAGRGVYFRLDYWAKLTGGGSYGHTVYQAKALNKVSSQPLICVTASRFELLDDIGVGQIVLPSPNQMADEASLIHNGAIYQNVIMEILRLYRPSYVFERLVLGNCSVARACAALSIPYIAEYNGSEITMARVFGGEEKKHASELQALELESLNAANLVSVVSTAVKDEIVQLGVDPAKVLVNPNCVDLEAYAPLRAEERDALRTSYGVQPHHVVIGFCGTFGGWHGIDVLAEALPQVLAARPNAVFLLIGEGAHKKLVRDAIDKHGLQSRVVDLGRLRQVEAARAMAACDVLLCPHSSHMGDKPFFGSPTKLFEYMAYGVGIVCSDLEQLGEVMRPAAALSDAGPPPEGARCILVAPGLSAELTAGTLRLIDDPDLRKELGRNARAAAAAHYTWDVHVQSLWRFAKGISPIGYHADRRKA